MEEHGLVTPTLGHHSYSTQHHPSHPPYHKNVVSLLLVGFLQARLSNTSRTSVVFSLSS